MAYSFSTQDDIQILKLDDLWNPVENDQLVKEVEQRIVKGQSSYLIDFSELPFMNSNGLAFLISILTRARSAGGEVVIANISEKIEQILVMTRLHSTFQVADTLEEGLAMLPKDPKN